ncbi:MAG: hypothetical protein COX62_01445 [Deltaproteobacteria bacterium CG_4_10_14_0_2_um_filter_43_8]|nr:MAG: hypothetical protein COV43_01435 [Deltaproteobacteria bacterium CG11_big_fil_rev_8_21_14_0_20_42_23]PJA21782.1 MAG: hypothetical protein COX62_01445 [Deltaproteobacteria bacterium CG_4_10_14_0_2_um_filter_43_8]PJC64236.1 MAG: hypothetical protein CO021_05260 [Deltaproteobacteria bacterium CG_4_9_14_0_2_um_filter_42_21]
MQQKKLLYLKNANGKTQFVLHPFLKRERGVFLRSFKNFALEITTQLFPFASDNTVGARDLLWR